MTSVALADALLVIDIGNTRIGLGVWDGDGVHDTRRIAVAQPDEWRSVMTETWARVPLGRRALVLGSVNPQQTARVQTLAEEVSGLSAARVRDDLPLPLPVEVENLREVGIDRVCSAAAAYERIQDACAVASFGTAITVDCVSADGRFLGGVILPGLQMACDALHDGTAQLPRVTPRKPDSVFARNTHDAIVGGVVYGALGALREVVERFATDLGRWPQLVITGGDAPLVGELAEFADAVVPDLCLMGIALTYRRASMCEAKLRTTPP
jgi:type III pantothenate kinase